MKKNVSGKFLLAVATFAIVVLSSFRFTPDKPNFSGQWKLDAAKSQLGEFSGRAATAIKIEQKDGEVAVSRTTPGFNGGEPVTTSMTLPFSGATVESEGWGGSKRKSTAQWSTDGQTLTIVTNTHFERDGQSFDMKSTENWTMKDGMLSVATSATTPQGEMSMKAVYTK
jgi:hypothetical protein